MAILSEEQKLKSDYDAFFDKLLKSRKTVVLTGAGISTLSGIPDFRSDKGLFSETFGSLRVEDIIEISFFRKNPEVFWSWSRPIWYNMHDYNPNVVHKVLRMMEEKKLLGEGIYTQNIDGLHERAGSRKVGNLHGTIERSSCIKCGESFSYDWTKAIVDKNAVPTCPYCGSLIKPDIVFYGEALDSELLREADKAFLSPELCIVLGSSLIVQPAAALPYRALRSGAMLCVVNRDETYLTQYADYSFTDLEEWGNEMEKRLSLLK